MIADGFYFLLLFWRKENIKFLLTSLDSLSNSKNPSSNSNPLQRACCGIRKAAFEPRTVPKSACDSEMFRKLFYLLQPCSGPVTNNSYCVFGT